MTAPKRCRRSEEHTSELQSRFGISYAVFFFNNTATTEIYTLSLHDALPISLDILYGEDANLNGLLDPNENDGPQTLPDDNRDGRLDHGIFEYLTVYSRQPNAART